MEAMQDFTITIVNVEQSAVSATLAVDTQEKMIAAMRAGDPCLPFACVMLCIMQQSAAMAEMNLALYAADLQSVAR